MKKIIALPFLLATLFLSAQQNAVKWENLFNGKDLSGWKQLNGKAKYEVKEGVIVGTAVPGESSSFLATEKEYGDFILELEFRVDSPLNSGIQFRSDSSPAYMNGRVHGYQAEIDPSPRAWSGGIYDEAGRLWLYTMDYNPGAKKAFKNGQWNKYRIECIGTSIRTWVNNIPCAWVIDDITAQGFIALQVHAPGKDSKGGEQIRWRNIRIGTGNLQPSPPVDMFVVNLIPNTLCEQEKRNGVQLLWDGQTTAGWRGAYKDKFPEKGWEIKDGALSVLSSAGQEAANGGDIVTVNEYGAFELQFEFRLTDSANSGIKYFVTEKENNSGSAIGLEYQVLDDDKHPDAKMGVVGNRTLASLYDLIPPLKFSQAYRKIGEWNRGMVVVYPDNHIEHWLNGYKVVEYQRGTSVFYALVARSKYAQWPGFGMAAKGHILLQDHGNYVSYRSIRIRELK